MASTTVYKGLTIQVGADTKDFTREMTKATKVADGTSKQLRQINRELRFNPNNVELLAQKQGVLAKQTEAAKNKLELLKEELRQLDEQGVDHLSPVWTQLTTDIAKTEYQLDTYKKAMEEAAEKQRLIENGAQALADKLDKVADKANAAGEKLKDYGGKISGVGDKLTAGVTAPLVAAGTAAVMAAMDIDSGLTSVIKTVDGTEEQYQQLKQAAIEFSKTNAVSAEQMLELDALGAQLSFTIDELELFGQVASGLDIATDMDAETAATEMAQFANITQMAHSDIERYASAIVNLGNNMATTESKVSAMGQRIAAAGKQTKMSQSEILGWAGAMSSLGIEAEAGGTAFSNTISTIDAAVAKGGEKLETFAKIAGMSSQEFADSWNNSATETMQSLLQGVDQAENMTLALEEMGVTGIRQSDVLKRLAGNTQLVGDALDYANEGWEQNTALQTEVDNRNQSLASQFEILKNKVIAVAEQVGKPLADALLDAVDAAEPLIKIVTDGAEAFANMSKEEQRNILQQVAMVAALGPLLSIAGRVVSAIGGISEGVGSAAKAFKNFAGGIDTQIGKMAKMEGVAGKVGKSLSGISGGLIGIAATAVAAVAALGIAAWSDYQKKLETVEKASKSFADMEAEVRGELGKVKGATRDAGDGLSGYSQSIGSIIDDLDKMREHQANANQEFMDSFRDIQVDSALLDTYVETINRLANQDLPLAADEQAELALAVENYNKMTGDSVEIIDSTTGALSKSTTAIYKNKDAWLAQLEIEVYEERIKESLKGRIEAEEKLTAAKEKQKRAQQQVNDIMQHAAEYGEGYAGALAAANQELANCDKAVQDATRDFDTYNKQVEDGSRHCEELKQKMMETAASTDDWKKAIKSFGDELQQKFEDSGLSTDELCQKLADAGVSVSALKDQSASDLWDMWQACNGDVGLMIAKLQELDRQKIEQKKIDVDSSAIDRAKAKWGELAGLLRQPLQGKALISVQQQTASVLARASGGFVVPKHAAGGVKVPKYARGGILDSATLTSIGWVGEDGAEAVLPLDNPKYAGRFARKIAEQMLAAGANGNSKTVNVFLDGLKVNDSKAMRQAALNLLDEIGRKAAMNLG